jgi:hypothetical protein
LPTQDEVNRWDDAQRARGHVMVRPLPRASVIRRRLEQRGYQVALNHHDSTGQWVAVAVVRDAHLVVARGSSQVEALEALAGELGVVL